MYGRTKNKDFGQIKVGQKIKILELGRMFNTAMYSEEGSDINVKPMKGQGCVQERSCYVGLRKLNDLG